MTAALEGGECSVGPGHALPPGKTRYSFYRRLGGPQGRSGREEISSSPGFDPDGDEISDTMGTLSFPGCKERPGRDADPSPSSSAVVNKE